MRLRFVPQCSQRWQGCCRRPHNMLRINEAGSLKVLHSEVHMYGLWTDYAQLQPAEDPSDLRRQQPTLKQRWPSCGVAAARQPHAAPLAAPPPAATASHRPLRASGVRFAGRRGCPRLFCCGCHAASGALCRRDGFVCCCCDDSSPMRAEGSMPTSSSAVRSTTAAAAKPMLAGASKQHSADQAAVALQTGSKHET